MSWDGIMLRLPNAVALDDLPNDWKSPVIGILNEVQALLQRAFPGQQHAEGRTCVVGDEFWIEFNYRIEMESGSVEHIGVRSNAGPGAMASMKRACEMLDLRMVDCQTSEIADFSDVTAESMERFAVWRDRIINQTRNNEAS